MDRKLALVTYNLWLRDYAFKERSQALIEIMRSCDADLIGLQEVVPEFLEKLLATSWITEQYHLSDMSGDTLTPYGVLLLSKFPFEHTSLIELPSSRGRRALLAEVDIGTQKFLVAVVHLESKRESSAERAAQLSIIFSELSRAEHAVILGDFNFCSSWSEENRNIDPSFTDLWPALHSDHPGYTEDTKLNLMRLEHKGEPKQVRFDRILFRSVDRCWSPQSVHLLGTEPISQEQPEIFPSDHFGLCGVLRYKT